MSLLEKLMPYRKAIVGGLGLALTVASAWFDPSSSIGRLVTFAVVVASGYGIYRVPNSRAVPDAVKALKALKPPTGGNMQG